MRISDWSSHVCSSDLDLQNAQHGWPVALGNPVQVGNVKSDFLGSAYDRAGRRGPAQGELDRVFKNRASVVEVAEKQVQHHRRSAHMGHAILFDARQHDFGLHLAQAHVRRSEEHTSELQSLMRNSYAVFCLTTQKQPIRIANTLNT